MTKVFQCFLPQLGSEISVSDIFCKRLPLFLTGFLSDEILFIDYFSFFLIGLTFRWLGAYLSPDFCLLIF